MESPWASPHRAIWTTGGAVSHLWWEVYGNSFTWNKTTVDIYPMRMRGGGTGLLLLGEGRNPSQGQSGSLLFYCDGTHNWDDNMTDPAAPGWPCLSQAGRNAGKSIAQILAGDKQASFPLYLWNNGMPSP